MSKSGKKYGTEYTTLLKAGNIKFVRYNDSKSAKTPMETMTKGRVYVTVNNVDQLKSITFYDNGGKRTRQIDITGRPHKVNGKWTLPHTHIGYEHDEGGTKELNKQEMALVEKVVEVWYNRRRKQ